MDFTILTFYGFITLRVWNQTLSQDYGTPSSTEWTNYANDFYTFVGQLPEKEAHRLRYQWRDFRHKFLQSPTFLEGLSELADKIFVEFESCAFFYVTGNHTILEPSNLHRWAKEQQQI